VIGHSAFSALVIDGSRTSPQIVRHQIPLPAHQGKTVYGGRPAYELLAGVGRRQASGHLHRARERTSSTRLNAYHTRAKPASPVTEFTNSTTSMHFHDSVLVFEKGRMLRRPDVTIGLR
jgi:hypothetical protein